MSAISTIRTFGVFTLLISTPKNGKYCYLVSAFTLSKVVGQLPQCKCTLSDFSTHSSIGALGVSSAGLNALSQLIKISQTSNLLFLCRLILRTPSDGKLRLWFTGCVTAICNQLQTQQGIQSGVVCSCSSRACQLMYNYVADYTLIPGSSQVFNGKLLNDIGVKNALKTFQNYWATGRNNLLHLTSDAMKAQTGYNLKTILELLLCAFQAMQKRRNTYIQKALGSKLGDAFKPSVKSLKLYISCLYGMSDLLCNAVISKGNPWLLLVNNIFINGLQNTTILNSLLSVLKSKLLTIVPLSRAELKGLLKIVPLGVKPFILMLNGYNVLTALRLDGAATASDVIARLRVPDRLFVNLAGVINFIGNKNVKQALNGRLQYYGQFPDSSYTFQDKLNLRIRSVQSPQWLSNLSVTGLKKTRAMREKTETQKPVPVGESRDGSKSNSGLGAQNQTSAKELFLATQKVADAFAALMYYSMYCNINSALLSLPPTDLNLDLDKLLGLTIKLLLPVDLMHLNGTDTDIPQYYGMLLSVLYSYQSAKAVLQSSGFQMKAVIVGMTLVLNTISKVLFLQSNRKLSLYSKMARK